MGISTILSGLFGKAAKEVGLEKILDIGTRWIPDKEGQLELEKQLLEVNQEIIKNNKTVLDKVIPLTFPCCVWILAIYALVNLFLGAYGVLKTGIPLVIPFPDVISRLSIIFACGLVGKWNVKEFTKNKK